MSIDAMKQALEALQRGETKLRYEAITALRAAIEHEEIHTSEQIHTGVDSNTHQLEQEPVAMRYDWDGYGYQYIDSGSGSNWQTRVKSAEPLYTAPPEFTCSTGLCHYRKPLTDKQIADCVVVDDEGFIKPLAFARVIEAAHGIGEKHMT
jgi:hypothetical protein